MSPISEFMLRGDPRYFHPHVRRDSSTRSDLSTDTARTAGGDVEILDAVGRAKAFGLCLRRIWAVSANLPGRENSLPSLIPAPGMFSVPSHDRQHHEHQQCTFDFCEHSRVDFTSVAQHHEGCEENCGNYTFPLDQLTDRVEKGKFTAWKLASVLLDDPPSLLDSTRPYMAISHVWADGTGAGIWGPGKVNKCLYEFFCGIAHEFQCEGCWWDTISIPRDDETRGKALNSMQNYYAAARITLVHDLYLREWEWVDADTACFAVVMSPWYSRGWTALELAKSHKIKILFKARNDRYLIKDLDVDILAEIPPSSPHYATAEAIRKLRSARIQSFGDLLSILGPRDTSKPRDIPIISGLLAGVDVSGGLSQQEIYQRILRKLGKVAQGHLFHNSATMSAPGFSWCPTNILDMPIAEPKSALLELRENGDLEGTWRAYAINSVEENDFIWHSTHPLTRASLKSVLNGKSKGKHVFLAEIGLSSYRALLVRLMRSEEETTKVFCCHFVGPVYFRSALGSNKGDKCQEIEVRIGSTERMQEIDEEAWDYICDTIKELKATDEADSLEDTATTGRDAKHESSDGITRMTSEEDDPLSVGSQDWKALLYLEKDMNASQQLFDESQRFPPSKDTSSKSPDEMAMFFVNNQNSPNFLTSIQAFFYGNEGIIQKVKDWLTSQESNIETGRMMLLLLDENVKIKLDSDKFSARHPRLGGEALRLAVEKGEQGKFESLVTLLLDHGAAHIPNTTDGRMPIHFAVESDNVEVVRGLLTSETNPADPDAKNADGQSAIHLAAKNDSREIAELLVGRMKSKSLDAQDSMGRTALIVAAEEGRFEIAQLLLGRGASAKVRDPIGHIALHYAAREGHDGIVLALLKHAVTESQKNETGPESSQPVVADDDDGKSEAKKPNEEPNGQSGGKPDGESDDKLDSEGGGKLFGGTDAKGLRLERDKKAEPDILNREQQMALHLAAQKGKTSVVETLLKFGVKPSTVDSEKRTVLLLAAEDGHADTVGTLLEMSRHSWDQEKLDIALLSAAGKWYPEVVIKLHGGGARSGRQDSDGMTALHYAIEAKDERITEMLIKTQKDVDTKDYKKQQSALSKALDKELNKTVMALLEKGADANNKDSRQRTALHWAAIRRNEKIVSELLKRNDRSIVDEQDTLSRTALHWAARSGSAEVTRLLLRAQANPFALDKHGRSALILAAELRRVEAVKTLLDDRSDPTTRDKDGKSALDLAATKGFDEVVLELLKSPKMEDDKATERALKLAAEEAHLSVSIMLYEKIKDSSLRDSTVPTILFSAATASASTLVIERLIKMVTNPNHQDKDGRTALMLAVLNRKRLLFDKLLGLEANPDLQDNEKRTALMMAAKIDDSESVEALLRANANPNVQDKEDYTALHYAAEREGVRSVRALRNSGATDFNVRDSRNRTALHIAMEKLPTASRSLLYFHYRPRTRGNNIWYYLLRSGAKPNIQDKEGQTPLHWAVRKGRMDIAIALFDSLSNSVNLDIPDAEGRTPLLLAAERAYCDMVDLLLQDYEFQPDVQDKTGRTPLLLAAEGGDVESVSVLLASHANPNLADKLSRTPLLQAARNGHMMVVDELIGNQKAKPTIDARDNMGRTALLLAAENGHARIVESLLREGASPSIVDYEGKRAWQKAMDKGHASVVDSLLFRLDKPTQDMEAVNEALLLASRRGWTELVKVLLKQEADVTFKSSEGRTALHMAVMGGHHEVVQMLLGKGISIVIKDRNDRTALMQATEHGFESIVELLLAREEVITDIDGWMGPEALRCAAEKGNKGIVSRLLQSNVNPNAVDSARRTAMVLAAANGNREIVDFLLQQHADAEIQDNQSRTALHHAAWGGYDDVVKSLLEYGADVNALDNRKQSALHLAAERASRRVVELFLEKGANANVKSIDGQTVLHRAAWGGSREVVKLLRKSGADPFIRDDLNNKPWQVAAEKGHESTVKTLLEEEKSVCDELISKKKGLVFAAQKGYTAIAEALLNKGAEAMVKDQDGLTPLHWAAKRGDHEMVELLINRDGSINALDNQRRTPLCLGVLEGRATVVHMLLQRGADPNIPGEMGRTVLHLAAQNGNWEIVRILDNHKADPHARDNQKQKAWLLAAEAGYHQITRLLLKREVDLNPQNQRIEELFLQMAARGFTSMVQLLLEIKVNKDAKDRLGRVAIGLAAEMEKDEIVELLLKWGANPGIPDSNRQTPLLWAAKSGNVRLMKLILDNITSKSSEAPGEPSGPKNNNPVTNGNNNNTTSSSTKNASTREEILNHTDCQGRTALLIAIENGRDDAVKLLLNKGLPDINLDVQDTAKRTALHLAAERGNDDLVELLLKDAADDQGLRKKPDPTLRDTLGRTALLLAAEYGHNAVVEALLRISPETVDIPDSQERTALQVAAEQGNSNMIGTLLDKGADQDHQDHLGRTALLLAAENGEKEVVDLLLKENANQELADKNKRTPLLLAVANGDKAIVKALLDYPMADFNAWHSNDQSLLHKAVKSGNKDVAWLVAERITRLHSPLDGRAGRQSPSDGWASPASG
ncbi:hypothetical protein GP486_004548 [Trichoglossum hirsutum]|uniref:Heterokaryon incompatibility domain-containing protein n=1 Tax=Trichoglossum hirsutum TaxID=265104 RepID=A0A9P8LAN7_9PEZI|nr:hypothetical protein GP486_004548 [Trichoglossum hirsutum]